MRVDNPKFDDVDGQIECDECPLDDGFAFSENCRLWWYRNGDNEGLDCPCNMDEYREACRIADEIGAVK